MSTSLPAPARRSRSWRPLLAGLLSIATYFGARAALEGTGLSPASRMAAAAVPVPFFVWVLYEIVRASRRLDEMHRRIQLEALAIAYPVALVLLMVLGLLELAVPLDGNDWSYRHVWQMQGTFYLLGLFIAQRRYGVGSR
jgi:hypothetical protein